MVLGLLYQVSKATVFIELKLNMENSNNRLFIGCRIGAWRVFHRDFIISGEAWKDVFLAALQAISEAEPGDNINYSLKPSKLPRILRTARRWARLSPSSASYLLERLSCHRLEWSTRIGLLNPAVTGFTVGCLWFVKHRVIRRLVEKIDRMAAVPLVSVSPDFCSTTFELMLHCIFGLRVSHIITATGRLCWLMFCSFVRGERIEQPSH